MSQLTKTFLEKTSCHVDIRWFTVPLLIYVALPGILWLLGWVHPMYSVPAVLLLCYALYIVMRYMGSTLDNQPRVPFNIRSLVGLFIIAFVSLLISEMTGITGNVPQNSDYSVRNAMYQTLVACDWPVYLHDGSYLVYYLGFWLLPAAASKLTSPDVCWLILQFWVFFGLFLCFATLFLTKGWRAIIFILVLLGTSDAFQIYSYGAHRCIGWFCLHMSELLNCPSIYDLPGLLGNIFWFHLPSPLWNCINSYHLVIPTWCVCALLFTRCLPDRYYLFVASLLLPSSPLSAISVLLVLLVMLILRWDKNKISLLTILAAFSMLIPLAFYLCCNNAGMIKWSILRASSYTSYFCSWLPNILLVMLPICFLYRKQWKNAIYISFVTLFVFLPTLWIGASHANEFVLKGGCVLWFCYAWMIAFFELYRRYHKIILCAVLLTMVICPVIHLWGTLRSYRSTPQKCYISNVLEGHFNHSDDKPYCFQFRGKQPPNLLLQNPGESAYGVLSPLRTEVSSKQYYGGVVAVPGE